MDRRLVEFMTGARMKQRASVLVFRRVNLTQWREQALLQDMGYDKSFLGWIRLRVLSWKWHWMGWD